MYRNTEHAPVTHEIVASVRSHGRESHRFTLKPVETTDPVYGTPPVLLYAKVCFDYKNRVSKDFAAQTYIRMANSVSDALKLSDIPGFEPLEGPQHFFGWFERDFMIATIVSTDSPDVVKGWRKIWQPTLGLPEHLKRLK